MATPISINLLRTRSTTPPEVLQQEKQMHIFVGILLVVVIVAGITVSLTRLFFMQQHDELESQQARVIAEISDLHTVEGLLLSYKNRTKLTGRVLDELLPWDDRYRLATNIAPPPVLTTLSISPSGKIVMQLSLASLADVGVVIERLRELELQGALEKPELSSLSFTPDNGYSMSLEYLAVKTNL